MLARAKEQIAHTFRLIADRLSPPRMTLAEAQQHKNLMLKAALESLGSEVGARCPKCGHVSKIADLGYPTVDRPA